MFESDVIPLYDLNDIDMNIIKTIEEMKEHSIDFSFIGEGCFGKLDSNSIHNIIQCKQVTDTLYTCSSSRCAESFIVSPRGIQKFIEYINKCNNITVIDFMYNFFFTDTNTLSSWRIPELFKQGSQTGLYKGNVPVSTL